MQHRELKKHSVLAVAQRARLHSATASICIVDVPPVTTYHAPDGAVLPKLSGLLESLNPAEQSGDVGTLRHADRSYSHGSGPGSPHMHGHGHAHAELVRQLVPRKADAYQARDADGVPTRSEPVAV